MRALVSEKVPNSIHISHDGYTGRKWQQSSFPTSRWNVGSRHFSSTPRPLANSRGGDFDSGNRDIYDDIDSAGDYESLDPQHYLKPSQPITVDDLFAEARAEYDSLPEAEKQNFMALQNHYAAVAEGLESESNIEDPHVTGGLDREIAFEDDISFPPVALRAREVGWWGNAEQDDEFAHVEDADDEHDASDLTSVAHSELEVHREIREYTRVAAWDMPLLQRMRVACFRLTHIMLI
jgi:hypothetical protein